MSVCQPASWSQAAAIARDMVASASPCCHVPLAEAQLQRLGRVVPAPMQVGATPRSLGAPGWLAGWVGRQQGSTGSAMAMGAWGVIHW
jgi:hypothetical protein